MNSESEKQKDKRLSLLLWAVEKNTTEPDKQFLDELRKKSTAEFIASSANDTKNSQIFSFMPSLLRNEYEKCLVYINNVPGFGIYRF